MQMPPVITPRYIIGFSGHRSLKDPPAVKTAIHAALKELQDQVKSRGAQVELYCGAASGADLLALECARELNIPFHLVLPMTQEQFARDFDDPADWAKAGAFISAAESGANGGTFRVLREDQQRDECYYGQAARVVEASDILLAVWDGADARGLGGTAHVVELAHSQKMPVLQISPDAPARVPSDKITAALPEPDTKINGISAILGESHAGPISDAATLQAALDAIAKQKAPAFRRGIARAIWLHSAAALLGAIPSLFYFAFIHDPRNPLTDEMARWGRAAQIFTAVELVLVLAALAFTLRLHWGRVQKKWLQTRFAAEIVRGVRASRPWLDPLHPQVTRHLPQWRRFAITAALMASGDALHGQLLDVKKLAYVTGRLEDQLNHFASEAVTALRKHHLWHLVARWAAILAPFAVLFALLDKLCHWDLTESWPGALFGKFLPVALPLLAGAATALRNALDITRRAHRYPEMAERLQAIADAFAPLKTHSTAAATVARTEELLLDELVEWRLAAQHAGAH